MKHFFAVVVTLILTAQGVDLLGRMNQRSQSLQGERQLAWVDRTGQLQGTIGPRMASILDPSISPDGEKVAVRGREHQTDTDALWILEGTKKRRLTQNKGSERHMIWSPDGTMLAYSLQEPGGVSKLFTRAADGSGVDSPLVVSEGIHKWYPSWTPKADVVVFHTNNPQTQARDLWFVDVSDRKASVLVADDGIQALARLSHDGRFVSYQSNQTGKMEIYLTTFPKSDLRVKISEGGGTWAKWSENELFYWEGNTLVAVTISDNDGLRIGEKRPLFDGADVGMGANNQMNSYNPEYDVSGDGTKIVVVQRTPDN